MCDGTLVVQMTNKPNTVTEAARETPIRAEADVLVAGGGLGGVSAAIAAARAGAKTLVIERNGFLGGVATAGMCCSVANCFYTADHTLTVTGNAIEITDALAEATGSGTRWHGHKGHIIYDVEQAKYVLADLADRAGVEALYDTVIADAVVESGAVKGVIVESKSGREAILAKAVVDATGDSDVARYAGAPLHTADPKSVSSFCFRIGRVDVDRFVQHFIDHPGEYPEFMDVDWSFDEALAQYRDTGTLLFPHGGAMQMEIFKKAHASGEYPERVGVHDTLDACQMHALRDQGVVHIITGYAYMGALDVGTISRAIKDGRKMALIVTDFFRGRVPGFEDSFLVATADNLGIRTSYWIDGDFELSKAAMQASTRFDDAIARSPGGEYKFKHPGERAWGASELNNDVFDIPLRCLVPAKIDGLIMGAGRSVSAEDRGHLRVMAMTMAIGQGAGAAAAVAVKSNTTVRNVNVAAVQQELRRQGVQLS